MSETITIEVLAGGFILTYPDFGTLPDGASTLTIRREIHTSPAKLKKKVKEVIDNLSLVVDK